MHRAAACARRLPLSSGLSRHTRCCRFHTSVQSQHGIPTSSASKAFTVLAFESSADDTAAAVVSADRVVHSNIVIKQNRVHEQFNGIHPHFAVLAHTENMPIAAQLALQHANMTMSDIDGLAFTRGPGMGACLAVGANAAKNIAAVLGKPLVGVHHMRAHALTVMLTEREEPRFPHLTLLVSGGHTMLVFVPDETSFEVMAETLDEAIGDTFDKVASMLGLEWGDRGLGAALEELAASLPSEPPISNIRFPQSIPSRMCFSFAGLHGAVQTLIDRERSDKPLTDLLKRDIAARFQEQAVRQLEEKLALAIKQCRARGRTPSSVVVSGGVASNMFLRERIRIAVETASAGTDAPPPVYYPPAHLCTDNAVMIAWAAMPRFLSGETDGYRIRPVTKWAIGESGPDE